MEYDNDKVDDFTLALMCLVFHGDEYGMRAWKGFEWETMNRLYEKGFISEPRGKAKSVVMTEEGEKRARELFREFFVKEE